MVLTPCQQQASSPNPETLAPGQASCVNARDIRDVLVGDYHASHEQPPADPFVGAEMGFAYDVLMVSGILPLEAITLSKRPNSENPARG